MTVKANWGATHGPVWGAFNAALGAALFTLFSDMFTITAWAGTVAGLVVAACAYGAARHAKLHPQSAGWRAAAWILVGGWTTWARTHETSVTLPVIDKQFAWWAANGVNWILLLVLVLVAAVGGTWLAGRPEDPQTAQEREIRKQHLELAKRYNGRDDSRESALADEWELRIARTQNIGTIETVKVLDKADPQGKKEVVLIDPRTGRPVVRVIDGVEIFNIEFWTDDDGNELKTWNPSKKAWENDGFTFAGVFPEGGHSWRDISGVQLANDARLPAGCTVAINEGADRGTFQGRVQLVNVLSKDRPYPTDFAVKSILDGVHIGFKDNGKPATLDMAGHNTTNAGAPESGKTNCSNVAGMRLVETTDTLIFDYDIAGGGVSAPFLPEEWLDGRYDLAPQPGVAIAAPNVELAWIVSTIGVRLVAGRKKGYQALKRDGKVPLGHCLDKTCGCGGHGIPLIMHRVDEGWSLYKAGQVGYMTRANLEWIAGEGRPGRSRVFYGALGSTDEYIPNGVQRLAPNRIALRQPDETEIARFIGWTKGFDPDVFKKPGNAVVRDHNENVEVVKLLRLSDEDTIRKGVLACSSRRPVLDPVSERIANADIVVDHPQLVEYFKGKIDVVENGRYAQNDGHWIADGTLTIRNFWKNRWLFILPEMFPARFSTLMDESMVAVGQTPGQPVRTTEPPDDGTAAPADLATAIPTATRGKTVITNMETPEAMASAIHAMRSSEMELAEALAAGEAAAQAADRRYADRQAEAGAVQQALEGENWVPETVDGLPPSFRAAAPPSTAAPQQRPAVQPQNTAPKVADDPARQRIMLLGYIVAAGTDGLSVGPLRQRLIEDVSEADGGEPYKISDQAFRKSRTERLAADSLISQPYASADEDLLAPDGGKKSHWVATEAGVRFWERNRGKISQ